MTSDQIIQLIMGGMGALVALIIGLKWLDKDRNKILLELKEERNGRLRLIELSNERCAEDRVILHKKLDDQEKLIRELLVKQAINHPQISPIQS